MGIAAVVASSKLANEQTSRRQSALKQRHEWYEYYRASVMNRLYSIVHVLEEGVAYGSFRRLPLLASFHCPSGDSISIKLGEVFRGGAAEVGLLEHGAVLCVAPLLISTSLTRRATVVCRCAAEKAWRGGRWTGYRSKCIKVVLGRTGSLKIISDICFSRILQFYHQSVSLTAIYWKHEEYEKLKLVFSGTS